MLKYLCIIFLSLKFAGASAQRFNAFMFLGATTSQVSGDALGGFDKAGFTAGVGVSTPVSRKFDISFEPGYMQKGSRKPSKLDKGDPSFYLLRLNYIELPVLLSYEINSRLKVFAGPSAGWLAGVHEEDENGELNDQIAFNTFDISFCGGINYSIADQWQFSLRTLQSIVPVREFGVSPLPFLDGGQYNTVIALQLHYYFKPGTK